MQLPKTIKWQRTGNRSARGAIHVVENDDRTLVATYTGDRPPPEFFLKYPTLRRRSNSETPHYSEYCAQLLENIIDV